MEKFEVLAKVIGYVAIEVLAESKEDAKNKVLTSLGTEGKHNATMFENVQLPNGGPMLTELGLSLPEVAPFEDIEHWRSIEITEVK
jgi:hypothetical protein